MLNILLLGTPHGYLYLVEEGGQSLRSEVAANMARKKEQRIRASRKRGDIDRVNPMNCMRHLPGRTGRPRQLKIRTDWDSFMQSAGSVASRSGPEPWSIGLCRV